MSVERN